jgi:DnaJ-class molecular chaperone
MNEVPLSPSYYDTLQVSPHASAPVLKAAYRCLVQLNHPDKNPGDDQAAERLMAVIKAYTVLSDPEQRRRYDLRCAALKTERRGKGHPASAHSDHAIKMGARHFAFRPLD